MQWGDFDEDLVHIQRDIDYVDSTAHNGALKTAAANRYIPVPQELRTMLSKVRGFPQQYVFHTEEGHPWPQSSFKRIWLSLMEASYCVEEREVTKATKRKNDIIKQLKPTLTPHYFRHNYATLLFEAGVNGLLEGDNLLLQLFAIALFMNQCSCRYYQNWKIRRSHPQKQSLFSCGYPDDHRQFASVSITICLTVYFAVSTNSG